MAETDHRRRLKRMEDQERKLAFADFTHADAWRLGTMIVGIAAERSLPIAIRIMIGDQVAFHVGMPGSSADNDHWIARKERTVRRFGVSTFVLRTRAEVAGRDLAADLGPEYAVHGGCVPLRTAGGALLGTVTVSGLAQADDHALVVDAIQQFLKSAAAPAEGA